MFTKDLTMSYLLDFYRNLLTERQYDVLDLYFNDDLSLGEIAEEIGISRQGVRAIIKRGEEELRQFEDSLGLAKRFSDAQRIASEIDTRLEELKTLIPDEMLRQRLDEIRLLTAGLTDSDSSEE